MTHDELLWAINSVVENGTCETVGHYSTAKALRAVVELHKPVTDRLPFCSECIAIHQGEPDVINYPCSTIQAIEKELG